MPDKKPNPEDITIARLRRQTWDAMKPEERTECVNVLVNDILHVMDFRSKRGGDSVELNFAVGMADIPKQQYDQIAPAVESLKTRKMIVDRFRKMGFSVELTDSAHLRFTIDWSE